MIVVDPERGKVEGEGGGGGGGGGEGRRRLKETVILQSQMVWKVLKIP